MNDQARHIVHSFDEELAQVRRRVAEMGELVMGQLDKLMDAVSRQDSAIAYGITKREARVNQMEVSADTEIFVLLARRCPVAGDLRLVMAASKIVTHLERAGDEAAKAANVLLEQLQDDAAGMEEASRRAVLEAGRRTRRLLRDALGIFTDMDFAWARRLSEDTDGSHRELDDSMRALMGDTEAGARPLSDAVSRILILKALDRINDLAVEIAEDVIFLGSDDGAAGQ